MNPNAADIVRQRQDPLRSRYRKLPGEARITDHATSAGAGPDPFHGTIRIGDGRERWNFGIHRAIGGDHDLPNPGDMLCAALAACLDSTVRMIASRMGVRLKSFEAEVTASADVRGCLMVDRDVPVGFQRIDVAVRLEAESGADPATIANLAARAEQCCVILQTLRGGVPVTTKFSEQAATLAAAD